MKETRVAKRYAKALFELCLEKGLVEQLSGDMRMLAGLVNESRELRNFLNSPIIPNKKKKATLAAVFEGKVDGLLMNFMRLMVENNREAVIGAVAAEFHSLYKELKGIVSAELITVSAIDPTLREEIIKTIEQELDARVEMTEKLDESLLGGFLLQVEDKQFDASLLHKISKLSREFDVNIYEKGF